MFVLLAIPSRKPRSGNQRDSEIFDNESSEGDDFA
jgi:hypothetical protein